MDVRTGAKLDRQPETEANAKATVREVTALGADFAADPLHTNGQGFATYGVTPASVFDACAFARTDDERDAPSGGSGASISSLSALVRRALGARITDTVRPMNATYGARHSWHKVGQAIDFVPAAGVNSVTRAQIRALMAAGGVRVLELLGPGDRGHSNHWHIAFARPGQMIDRIRPVEEDEDWIVDLSAKVVPGFLDDTAHSSPASASAPATHSVAAPPPRWDVFATAEWRAAQGGGS